MPARYGVFPRWAGMDKGSGSALLRNDRCRDYASGYPTKFNAKIAGSVTPMSMPFGVASV